MNMKNGIAALLASALLLGAAAGVAQDGHEHTWGEWTAVDGAGHIASCTAEEAQTKTAKHYHFTATAGGESVRVCAVCGAATGTSGDFALLEGALAQPVSENPKAQRGDLVVRGLENPFPSDETVTFALTMTYAWDGGMATFKNPSRIEVPLDVELAQGYKLVRVSGASGDDSVQTAESWIDVDSSFEDGVLIFQTRTPALFLVKNGE